MLKKFLLVCFLGSALLFPGCKEDERVADVELMDVFVGSDKLDISGALNLNIPVTATFTLSFPLRLRLHFHSLYL